MMTPEERAQVAELRADAAEADAARLRIELGNQQRITAQYREASERLLGINEGLRDEIGRLRAQSAEAFAAYTYGRRSEAYMVVMSQWGEHVRAVALERAACGERREEDDDA
jgi:hypothetical protein